MEMKRITGIIAAALLAFSASFTSFAANDSGDYSMVKLNMPDVVAELKGSELGISSPSDVTATYGGEKLEVVSAGAFDPASDSTKAYLLIDASVSNDTYLRLVRDCAKNYVGEMSSNDAVEIVRFGTAVSFLLEGGESADEINAAVDSIESEDPGTALYSALDEVYKSSADSIDKFTRQYAIVFSDCENDIDTGITESEIYNKYSTHRLPVYACLPPNASRGSIDSIGRIARASGGDAEVINSEDAFSRFLESVNDVTIIGMRADNNYTSSEEKLLSIKINDSKTYNVDVAAPYSQTDTTAPEVVEATFDAANNRFALTFSEKVTGASERGAYSVEDAQGKKWTVSNVEALDKTTSVQLEMEQPLPNGDYTISFNGVTDASMEKNPVAAPATVNVSSQAVQEQTQPEPEVIAPQPEKESFPFWILIAAGVGLLVIIGAGVAVLLVLLNKRKNNRAEAEEIREQPTTAPAQNIEYQPRHGDEGENRSFGGFAPQGGAAAVEEHAPQEAPIIRHHVKADDSVRVSLHIKTGSSAEQTVEISIVSSVIVGRSSTCDIYIDDTKLSRQHFAIENVNHELFIMDMESKNGTFLNGSKIATRRKILNGDKITAGLSEISIRYME